MRPSKPALALGVFALGTVALAGPAMAFFAVTGDNPNGYAKAALLNPPTVKATRLLTGQVFFTVNDPPPGFEPEGYKVRTANENRVCEINDEDGTCTPGLLDLYFGKQTFHIRSFAGNWTSAPTVCTFEHFFDSVANCGGGSGGGGFLGLSLAATTPLLTIKDDLGISSSDGITNITEVTLLGTAIARSTVVLFAEGVEIGRGTSNDEGKYAIEVRLAEGAHEITAVTRYDGDESRHSVDRTITIDLTAPKLTVSIDASGDELRVTGTAGTASGDRDELKVVAGSESDTVKPSSSGKFASEVEAPEGSKVTVSQTDVAGNKSTESVTVEGKKAEEPKKPAADPKPADEPKSDEPKSEEPKEKAPEDPAPAEPGPAQP